MKIMSLTIVAVFTGLAAQAGEISPGEREVTVCVQRGSVFGFTRAESLVSEMFAGVGVTVQFRLGSVGCPPQGIVVILSNRTPENLMPGALAYALPYEGVHLRVFVDRIVQDRPKSLVQTMLAHVLVHEITHILQGFRQHSASGIMKARWEQKDFDEMARKPLTFANEDIDLIGRGLASRAKLFSNINPEPRPLATR